jgi:hypothetical protein
MYGHQHTGCRPWITSGMMMAGRESLMSLSTPPPCQGSSRPLEKAMLEAAPALTHAQGCVVK